IMPGPLQSARCIRLWGARTLGRVSAEKGVDIVRPNSVRAVVLTRSCDVVMHVIVSGAGAVLVQPDEWTIDDEENFHRLIGFVTDQSMARAWRFIHHVAPVCGPVVLEITPFARNRVCEHGVRMIMPVHEASTFGHKDIGPHIVLWGYPQRS